MIFFCGYLCRQRENSKQRARQPKRPRWDPDGLHRGYPVIHKDLYLYIFIDICNYICIYVVWYDISTTHHMFMLHIYVITAWDSCWAPGLLPKAAADLCYGGLLVLKGEWRSGSL